MPSRRWPLALLALAACGGKPGAPPDAAGPPDAPSAPDAAPPPGLVLLDDALAIDVTPDGRAAVFEDISTPTAIAHVIDTATGQVTASVELGDPSRVLATGVSADGRLSAFHGDPVVAGTWAASGGWADLASPFAQGCDQATGAAWDVSADGAVVVGMMWNGCAGQAFRATIAGGAPVVAKLDLLGEPQTGGAQTNRATVVSDDGKVVAGFATRANVDRAPAAWTAEGHGFLLDEANADTPGEVLSISADGTTMAGIEGGDGFVWTKGTGVAHLVRFDAALPSDPVYPNAMTADGAIVFGGVGDAFQSTPTAFAWTARGGMRPLADVAAAAGVAVPQGVILESVLGASADGTVLIGTALDASNASKTFVLRLPASALPR